MMPVIWVQIYVNSVRLLKVFFHNHFHISLSAGHHYETITSTPQKRLREKKQLNIGRFQLGKLLHSMPVTSRQFKFYREPRNKRKTFSLNDFCSNGSNLYRRFDLPRQINKCVLLFEDSDASNLYLINTRNADQRCSLQNNHFCDSLCCNHLHRRYDLDVQMMVQYLTGKI